MRVRSRSGRRRQRSHSRGAVPDPPHADGEHRPGVRQARAQFVGLEAYEAAGGVVMRDLCSSRMMAAGWRMLPLARRPGHRETESRGRDHRRRRLEVDRGGGRFPLRPRSSVCANLKARQRTSRPKNRRRSTRSKPNTPRSKPNTRTPTNFPKSWISVSAKSRRRCPPSKPTR